MAHARQGVVHGPERPLERLDVQALRSAVASEPLRRRVRRIDVIAELPSTNAYLLAAERPPSGLIDVCLAERQTAGRGRRGRRWASPRGAGLYLSAGCTFVGDSPELAALPLAAGVAARRAVAAACGVEAALKWPNDLVHDHRKLGGILVEAGTEPGGGCHVVIGIGINVAVPREALATFCDWPRGATDLFGATGGSPPSRTRLALALLSELATLSERFAEAGFSAYRDEWRVADYLAGRAVDVEAAGGRTAGVAAGIDPDGALLVATRGGELRRVICGDVSVRARP